jgi:hypothetical protein
LTAEAPEQVIWSNEVTEGFFKKRVVETQKITNYRIIQNSAYVGLALLEDIVVMNQHRVSESNYTSFGGMRGAPRIGAGKSKSRTVGDLVFIYQGKPHFIFRQINDPQGVSRLAKAARKTFIETQKTAEKMKKAPLQEQQRRQQQKAISNKGIIICPRCSSATNAHGSKYCNNCGYRFADAAKEGVETNTSSSLSSVDSSKFSMNKTIEPNINQFMTYEMPAYGVKINYPSNWRVGKGPTPSPFVIFQSPKENPSDVLFESVGISSYNITNQMPEQLLQGAINQLGKKHHDFTLI